MSGSNTPATPSPSPTPPHELAVAQKLPPDVLALVAKHLTLDTSEHRHHTFEDRRRDARSFARVCKAWQAAGTAAAWREVELLDYTSSPVIKHLEAHPKLYKHVESFSVDLQHLLQWHDGVTSPTFITSCPRLSRLELHGRYQPGPEFKVLQDKVDLCNLLEVVLIVYAPYTWYTRSGAVDRVVSPALLFAFLRTCINVRRFTYDGDQACINEAVEAPRGRRIKVDWLTLDIKNSDTNSETDRRSACLRSRFLLQFDLARLLIFKAHVSLRDDDILIALGRMVNLETLRLVNDHELDVAAIDALSVLLVRLVKLRDINVSAAPEAECPTSAAVLEAVKRLVDALPASVERLTLSVPLPEPFAEALLEERDGLEHLLARVYDPLDVRPETREMHWRKTVEPVYESADDLGELEEEGEGEGL